jgi:hypothetical protein
VARLLCSLMAVDATAASPPSAFHPSGAAVRAAAAAAATQMARHAWSHPRASASSGELRLGPEHVDASFETAFASRGDHVVDLLHARDGAMLRTAVESALAGASAEERHSASADGDGGDEHAKTRGLVQEGSSALLMWLATAAWSLPPDTECVVRFLDLMLAADDAHTLMHLTAALWYLLRHTPTRNRLMAAVYTAAEEAQEATATMAASPRMNPEVGGATTGGGSEGDGDSSGSDSEGSHTTERQTQTDTAGDTTMDEGGGGAGGTSDEGNTDIERIKRAADEEQRTAEAEAAAAAAAAPKSGRCLFVLERLGSRWVRSLKQSQRADDAVVKLFELWAASLWLALYRTEDMLEAVPSVYARTDACTFTVGPLFTAPLQARPRLTQRLLGVLQELMELSGPAFAAVRELALGLSWNLALRDLVLEARLAATGVSKTLLRCLSDEDASVQVPPESSSPQQKLSANPRHLNPGPNPN